MSQEKKPSAIGYAARDGVLGFLMGAGGNMLLADLDAMAWRSVPSLLESAMHNPNAMIIPVLSTAAITLIGAITGFRSGRKAARQA